MSSSATAADGSGVGRPAPAIVRRAGLDATRLLAFSAVCVIHGSRWGAADRYDTGVAGWLTLACRFAVPFFFLTSGYLLAGSRRPAAEDLRRSAVRIGSIFVFWEAFYVAAAPGGLAKLLSPKFDLVLLLTGAPAYPLWFLPALLVAICVTRLSRSWPRGARLPIVGLALTAGWLAAAWWSQKEAQLLGRYLSAIGYVGAGALWQGRPPMDRPNILLAWGLVVVGLSAQAAEAYVLQSLHLRPVSDLEFALGTAPLGLGVFLLALRWPADDAVSTVLAETGRGALGLFAAHLGVLIVLFRLFPSTLLVERLWVCLLAIACTSLLVSLMRTTPLRRFVE